MTFIHEFNWFLQSLYREICYWLGRVVCYLRDVRQVIENNFAVVENCKQAQIDLKRVVVPTIAGRSIKGLLTRSHAGRELDILFFKPVGASVGTLFFVT